MNCNNTCLFNEVNEDNEDLTNTLKVPIDEPELYHTNNTNNNTNDTTNKINLNYNGHGCGGC